MPKLKICFLDIERCPDLGYVWGKYDQNVIAVETDWHLLSYSVKWQGGSTVTKGLPDYIGYKTNKTDDKALAKDLWRVFNEADIIIAHHGDRADIPWSTARFLVHGFPPPSPYRTVDTRKLARKYFGFSSNKLDDLARQLGLGRKLPNTGFDLWKRCMDGDAGAWRVMLKYNEQDVRLLEKVYLKLRSWATTHPRVSTSDRPACPKCGSTQCTREGYSYTLQRKKQRWQCKSCFGWWETTLPKVKDVG
jgi:hypothetical protein